MSSKVTVLHSGGLDSTVLVGHYRSLGYSPTSLFVDYGQKAAEAESRAVRHVAESLGQSLTTISCSGIRTEKGGEIPGRNGLLVMAALGAGIDTGLLGLGIHAGTPYADCSLEFVSAMQGVLDIYTSGRLQLDTPLLSMEKPEIVSLARELAVDFSMTYSCEESANEACLSCPSCLDRALYEHDYS